MIFGRIIAGLPYYNRLISTHIGYPSSCQGVVSDECTDLIQQYTYSQTKLRHYTYIFNTFVFLQIFNWINCRKIGGKEFNVFEKFFHNLYFLAIVIGTFAAQIVFVQIFPSLINCCCLSRGEWGACIAAGSTPLIVSFMLKLTPQAWVDSVPIHKFVSEDK